MQKTLVFIILAASALYAAWWLMNVIRHANDPCYGCTGCPMKDAKRKVKRKKYKKLDCWHKK